ncbi:MAG TPA: lipopolysaccharide biosynthesis protein [Gaiellaceae bacterium]|nr:lipopolysaccharide biosynthesis protein [Gaiellaceae bacterium]
MAGGLLRRRAGAAAGTYASVALGFAASIVAARLFSRDDFGRFTLVMSALALLQIVLDLTIEEALIKFGFRYIAAEDWGRLRRLFRQTSLVKVGGAALGTLGLLGLAAISGHVFKASHLAVPLAIAAANPLLQAPEGMSAVALFLRGRYDVRGWFFALSMALRLGGIAIAAPYGVSATVAVLVVEQGVTSACIGAVGLAGFRRFPKAPHRALGEDARAIRRFILQSSVATGIVSVRSTITPVVLGVVSSVQQVSYFRVAQSPQQGLNAASAPIRMVLLTEQTRDWERGQLDVVFAGIRRYTLVALAGAVVLLPPVLAFMPTIVPAIFGAKYDGAVTAARLILVAGALQLVVGWSKSFAVTAGRPQLRIWTHGLETALLLPLAVLLGIRWGATGAATAVLVSSVGFAASWAVLYGRIRRDPQAPSRLPRPEEVHV